MYSFPFCVKGTKGILIIKLGSIQTFQTDLRFVEQRFWPSYKLFQFFIGGYFNIFNKLSAELFFYPFFILLRTYSHAIIPSIAIYKVIYKAKPVELYTVCS